jgi:tetratricopeptide (TPR) repeat protein
LTEVPRFSLVVMNPARKIPGRPEVEEELQKILDSQIFKARAQVAKVLSFLVIARLNNTEVVEETIRSAFFPSPPYKEGTNVVRITVDHARKALSQYYAHEGKNDRVLIGIPQPSRKGRPRKLLAGEAYKAFFKYNANHPINKTFERGAHLVRMRTLYDLLVGLELLDKVTADAPNHVGAWIARSEGMLRVALVGDTDPKGGLEAAYFLAQTAAELAPDNWHAQATLGTVLLFMRKVEEARARFEISLRCDENETLEYTGYHTFLLATGDRARAFKLLAALAEKQVIDPYLQTLLLGFCYLVGCHITSYDFWDVQRLDNANWFLYLVESLVNLAAGSEAGCVESMEKFQSYLHERYAGEEYRMPGLRLLCMCTKEGLPMETWNSEIEKEKERICQKDEGHRDWFNLSLCYLAGGGHEAAVEMLEKAWEYYDPRIIFIDLLPLFDSLRKYKRFLELVNKRLKPPR